MYPLTVTGISDGTATHDYAMVGWPKENATIRREAAAALDQPALLQVGHETSGKDLRMVTRSRVGFSRVVEDADGNQGTQEAYLVIVTPDKITTTASVKKTAMELLNFMGTSGILDQLLAREV